MKRIKRLAALLLALILMLSLCACGASASAVTAGPSAAEAHAPAAQALAAVKTPQASFEGKHQKQGQSSVPGQAAAAPQTMPESFLEMKWEDAEKLLDASGIKGDFFPIPETGMKVWVPEGFQPVTLAQEYLDSGYKAYYETGDGKAAIAATHLYVKDKSAEEYLESVKKQGIEDGAIGTVNGRRAVGYTMPEEGYAIIAFPADDGYVLEVIFAPCTDEAYRFLANAVLCSAQPAVAEVKPLGGEYTLFAMSYQGYTVDTAELEMSSVMTLNADGAGLLTMDEDKEEITSWTQEGSKLTITLSDDSSATAAVERDIICLDIYGTGDMICYYAQAGTDTSFIETTPIEEVRAALAEPPSSMLYSYWGGIDPQAGAHLSYEVDTGYMDAHQIYDVHTRDGVYYSAVTTQVKGMESTRVTFFRDGTAYNLYPEDMTGLVVTTTSSSIVTGNVLRLDHLYLEMDTNAKRKDFTVEKREIDGVTYTAEVFPAGKYTAEAVYCFDENGQLVYYIEGAPVIDTGLEIGESVYKVHAVDTAVNEALFDISAYAIS